MTKNVLLVGLKAIILDQVQKNLDVKDVRLFTGSSVERMYVRHLTESQLIL
jgi:hypothetical protein